MSPRTILPVGSRFGRLVVIGAAPVGKDGRSQFLLRCDCGAEVVRPSKRLKNGSTQSCGCLFLELAAARLAEAKAALGRPTRQTHGEAARNRLSPEYIAWRGMIARCENPKWHAYHRYGGRGIIVCDRWRTSFENFLSDMGRKPSSGHSIDRWPNPDGNYEPSNCRWATAVEQARNKGTKNG